MAGTVNHAKLDSKTARANLKRGLFHWESIVKGKVHLGYQRQRGDEEGRWILRRNVGHRKVFNEELKREVDRYKYRTATLGYADDARKANDVDVLSYEQADAKARAMVDTPQAKTHKLTVRQAMKNYADAKRAEGRPVGDLITRTAVHILPELGDLVVTELTDEILRKWLATMAAMPAQTRAKNGKPRFKAEPVTDEDIRRRRATANRVLMMLKAALNFAFDDTNNHITNRDAWGRRLKPFKDVEAARLRFFTIDEARRLLNASSEEFRPLLRAALETGCRYGELGRLEVQDFITDTDKLSVRRSKTGKSRYATLSEEGADFFRAHCAGRPRTELMFRHDNGSAWKKADQSRPMREACEHARVEPAGFHTARHTWASHAVMNGMPLLVVARNLGHKDTRMVEYHYGHLANDFVTEAIRAGAPVYGAKTNSKIAPVRR